MKTIKQNHGHEHRTSQSYRPAARKVPALNSPRKIVPNDSSPANEKNGFNILYCSLSSVPSAPSYIVPLRNRLLTVTVCMHSTTWLPLYSPLSMDYELRQLPYNMPAATMPGRHVCATCSLFMESSTSWQLSRSW